MPIITISRGSASGGRLLAEGLSRKLGFTLISREQVVHEASTFGVNEDELQKALLEPPGFWDRFRHERHRYLGFIQSALCEHVKKDGVIYHGNAGHLLLRGVSHVVCIRLIAPLEFRVRMVQSRMDISRPEIIAYIEKQDDNRRRWTQFLYGVDSMDPSLYDLIVNLKTLTIDRAVEVAAIAATGAEFQATDESRQAMADLSLASKVRAVLAADKATSSVEVEISAHRGVVSIRGKVRPFSLVESVIHVASGVEGVTQVNRDNLDSPEFTV